MTNPQQVEAEAQAGQEEEWEDLNYAEGLRERAEEQAPEEEMEAEEDTEEEMEEEEEQEEEMEGEEQEGEEEEDDEAAPFDNEFCPRNPNRMKLTEEEKQWAKAIKEAIEASPEIDNLTDYMYVQYAMIDRDNVEQSLQRAQHFQIFRQEYKFADTLEEGRKICRSMIKLLPKVVLSISFNQEEQNYVCVVDIAALHEKYLKTDDNYRTLLGFAYFIGHIMSPDFTAIRRGMFFVVECEGYDWKNLSMTTRRRVWTESLAIYPYKIRQVKYFHTGVYANLAASLMKRFLPEEVYSKFQVGCQFAGRLDSFYAVPNTEVSNQRLMERIEECLRTRYTNIQKFKLSDAGPTEDT